MYSTSLISDLDIHTLFIPYSYDSPCGRSIKSCGNLPKTGQIGYPYRLFFDLEIHCLGHAVVQDSVAVDGFGGKLRGWRKRFGAYRYVNKGYMDKECYPLRCYWFRFNGRAE